MLTEKKIEIILEELSKARMDPMRVKQLKEYSALVAREVDKAYNLDGLAEGKVKSIYEECPTFPRQRVRKAFEYLNNLIKKGEDKDDE